MDKARRTFVSGLTGLLVGAACRAERADQPNAGRTQAARSSDPREPPGTAHDETELHDASAQDPPDANAGGRRTAPGEPIPPRSLGLRDLDVREFVVDGDRTLGRRFTLFVPTHLAAGERVPLLVLLHGLGETGEERMGAYAWAERYGLGSAYERLRRPPVTPTSRRGDFTDAHLQEVNAALGARPFRGMAIACPYTPNIGRAADPEGALDRYARWIAETVVPRAREEAPVFVDPARTALDGCSLGGYVGLEVFLRRPEAFGAWGGVQSAFGAHRADGYADRIAKAIARVGPRDLHLETSSGDPFREANTRLSTSLAKRGVAHDFASFPGPHDQPWLREVGTLAMLLWHDRRVR